jgi:hypothetical protein
VSVPTVSLPASIVVRFSGAHSSTGAASLAAADADATAGAEDAAVEADSCAQDARRRAADAAATPTAARRRMVVEVISRSFIQVTAKYRIG